MICISFRAHFAQTVRNRNIRQNGQFNSHKSLYANGTDTIHITEKSEKDLLDLLRTKPFE